MIVVVFICAILLVAMVVGLVAVKSAIEGWLKGDEFRDLLVKKAGLVLKSEIELSEMNWQGSEVYSDKFHAAGFDDAAFSKLGLDGVRATFGGIKEQAVTVPMVTVNRMSLLFSDKREKRPAG